MTTEVTVETPPVVTKTGFCETVTKTESLPTVTAIPKCKRRKVCDGYSSQCVNEYDDVARDGDRRSKGQGNDNKLDGHGKDHERDHRRDRNRDHRRDRDRDHGKDHDRDHGSNECTLC
ncbi:hypothetical protein O9G_005530 [Rozella allomycis CSF55]|nr:hypothetical protein O9G_005530 [Rozella allomycis CSF55]|eukprot:EPZ36263.1 hypothetical protein O9G_005530 [Rozella allomycis CSF55]